MTIAKQHSVNFPFRSISFGRSVRTAVCDAAKEENRINIHTHKCDKHIASLRVLYRNEETSNNTRPPWLLIRLSFFLHVFHVWFLFCFGLYVVRFSTLLSVSSANFGVWCMWFELCVLFNVRLLARWHVLSVRTVCARARARAPAHPRTHTHCTYVVMNRHQVFNVRNENEATTYVSSIYRLNDVTNVCLTVHICNTIDFASVASAVWCMRLFSGTCWCCCVARFLSSSNSFPLGLLFIHCCLCQICRSLSGSLTRLTTTRTLPYTFNHHYTVYIWSAICSIEYTANAQNTLLHLRLLDTAFF